MKIFEQFKNSQAGVLLATDVMGRGIDIAGVQLILQVDVPTNPENFVHRVGRTGRGEEHGSALLLLDEKEIFYRDYLAERKVEFRNTK